MIRIYYLERDEPLKVHFFIFFARQNMNIQIMTYPALLGVGNFYKWNDNQLTSEDAWLPKEKVAKETLSHDRSMVKWA